MYLSEGNYYAEIGSYVHSIMELIFKKELTVENALTYFENNYDSNVFYKVKDEIMKNTYNKLYDYFNGLSFPWIKNYDIIGVELKAKFKLYQYDFIGYIDLLLRDKRDGRLVVLDHKSSAYPFKKDGTVKKSVAHSFYSYKKQMYLYAHAVHQLYDEFPKEMTWHHFKENGKLATIPFIKQEYDEAMKWFKTTIKKIEKETDFHANTDYFYCNNLCNFRNSCEYNKQSKQKWWKKK